MFGKANIEIISPVDKGLKKKKFVQLCNCLQIKIPLPHFVLFRYVCVLTTSGF